VALNITVLVGGVGGAKLAYGLARIVPPENLKIVVNTGDDFWHLGLRICPDLDTILYTLSGRVDPVNGWGIGGDTTQVLDTLRRYGEDTWFRLGDQDIALHLLRTQWWHAGVSLTEIVARLTKKLGIPQSILPMTDAPVATIVDSVEYGELDFQEYFVRYRWQPTVKALRFAGIAAASPPEPVRAALATADVILIAPSNPWLSIDPILAVAGLRRLIMARDVPRVAISPIVGGAAIKGPAAKLMVELGYEASAPAVADYYSDLINGFVYDVVDAHLPIQVAQLMTCETVMKSEDDKVRLAQTVLEWIKRWI
jgi:LPPG:FO 2-phospho-L-lactate transferase